jgi:hypothetical protein
VLGGNISAPARCCAHRFAGGWRLPRARSRVCVDDSSEAGDRFGQALAAGDLNADGFAELAVGAPREDVGSLRDAGAVTVLLGDTGGLTGAASVQYTQDTPGVGGSAENGDLFGFALAAGVTVFGQPRFAELAIVAPGEDVFTVSDAGAVTLLFGNVGGLQGPGSEGFPRTTSASAQEQSLGTSSALRSRW